MNIYCSQWTLLPDSESPDAVFHLQTKAHVCALWRHAAWPEGLFWRMTKQARVLDEAQNGDLALIPCVQTPFSPLLLFSSSLVPSLFLLYRHFLPAFFARFSRSPLSEHSFVSGWKVEWACVSAKGADEGMTNTQWRGLRGEGSCSVFPRMRDTVQGRLPEVEWRPDHGEKKRKCALDSSPPLDQLLYPRGRHPFLLL